MTQPYDRLGLSQKSLPLLLIVIAPLANLVHIPMLFDVYLIFGSVATMIAVRLVSLRIAVLVAISGSLVTVFLWGHPWALLIFTLEALVVGILHRRWNQNLVLADMLYWLTCGMPLIGLFYFFVLGNEWSTTLLIALKQPLNGVLNALFASLLAIGLATLLNPRRKQRTARFGFSEALFIALLLGISLAGTVPVVVEGVRDQIQQERHMAQRLTEQASFVARQLEQQGVPPRLPLVNYLSSVHHHPDIGMAILGTGGEIKARRGTMISLAGQPGELLPRRNGLELWQPLDESHDLRRWQTGAYRITQPLQGVRGLSAVVVELPAAPLVEQLRIDQLLLLAIMFAIIMLGALTAQLLSVWLTRPLTRLTRASNDLTLQITSGQLPRLPSSILAEYNDLSNTLSQVSLALTDAFQALNHSRETLEHAVQEKTAELSHSNTLLNSVLNSATEVSVIATDTQGLITIFNRGAERMLGYQADEIVGKHTPVMIHAREDVEARVQELSEARGTPVSGFQALVENALQGTAEIRDRAYIHKDGHAIPVALIITAMEDSDGRINGYVCVAIDISERQRMDTLKDEFISTVSHELRTPLTSMSGALALVLNGTLGEVPEPMANMLQIADSNARRLIELVNDLLDIQKITSGHLTLHAEHCHLPDLIRDAVEQNRPYGRDRGVTVEISEPLPDLTMTVDRLRLIQALSNLLSNAIKFSPDNQPVQIEARTAGDTVTLSVIDRGAGIPKHFQDRIFHKFAQADGSDARQKGGTGLGLAITRELVERLGGEISFDSGPDRGTRFDITLPLRASGAIAADTRAAQARRNAPIPALPAKKADDSVALPKVLHVEDDQDLLNVLSTAAKHRFEVHSVSSLAAAREELSQHSYQLVLLDIGLPDGNGWQLLPDIYRQQPQANVVILSGQHLSGQELDLVEATFTKSQISIDLLMAALEAKLSGGTAPPDNAL